MWKATLVNIVESFAVADPVGYMYYLAAKRETELQTAAQRDWTHAPDAQRQSQRRIRLHEEASA